MNATAPAAEPATEQADATATASAGYLAAGAVLIAAYLALPDRGLAQAAVMLGLLGVSVVLLAVAIGRLDRAQRWPWLFLLAGEVVYGVTTFAWYLLPVGWNRSLGYPSIVDAAFFAAYALMGVALMLLLRRHDRPSSAKTRGVTLDALIATVAAAVVVEVAVLEPLRHANELATLVGVVSLAYPISTLGLAAAAMQLLFRGVLRSAPGLLLAAFLAGETVTDLWYARSELDGTFYYGHPMFVGWIASYAALGALALHPEFGASAPNEMELTPRRRMTVYTACITLAFVVFARDSVAGGSGHRHVAAELLGGLTMGLVLLRVRSLTRDVTTERALRAETERLAAELLESATHDPLTGLANRAVFDDALDRSLAHRHPAGTSVAVLLADLDSFKSINDTLGHVVGDDVLRAVAGRLRDFTREADLVARLGGDEFALIVTGASARVALLLGRRLVDAVNVPLELDGRSIQPSVSVGVHLAAMDETSRTVMMHADTALYAAKVARTGSEMFDPERHRRYIERYHLELEMRAASADQFVVHYQPVVALADRRIVGAEALIRWNHPTRGLLGPQEFIGVAEESGAIVEIGCWVMRRACADAQRWRTHVAGAAEVGVGVNLSRRQLQSASVVDDVAGALADSGLAADALTLEITETALMADPDDAVALLKSLKALGVSLAMDDFGTGYSSLAQLRTLPVDTLKIDKAFVDGIAREDEEWALAAAIIRLAGSLDKRTLAEGVERGAQLAHLRSLGCELGQGYLFARPMPLADFERHLSAATSARS